MNKENIKTIRIVILLITILFFGIRHGYNDFVLKYYNHGFEAGVRDVANQQFKNGLFFYPENITNKNSTITSMTINELCNILIQRSNQNI